MKTGGYFAETWGSSEKLLLKIIGRDGDNI